MKKSIEHYLEIIRQLVTGLYKVEVEGYQEQVLTRDRVNLRIRLRFVNNSLLEISEAIRIVDSNFTWLSYRYHYQRPDGSVIFRYDNTPHHPDVKTHPDHKHIGESVIESQRPDIEKILSEVKEHLCDI
jgi:hypothetical protein